MKTPCPFKPGDTVIHNGKKYDVVALAGSGESVIYVYPHGQKMEGTNRIALKTIECKSI